MNKKIENMKWYEKLIAVHWLVIFLRALNKPGNNPAKWILAFWIYLGLIPGVMVIILFIAYMVITGHEPPLPK